MFEDKLTLEQRLRLEALNQAVMSNMHMHSTDAEIVATAQRFLVWLEDGK